MPETHRLENRTEYREPPPEAADFMPGTGTGYDARAWRS